MPNDAGHLAIFVSEAREHLATISAALIALEQSPQACAPQVEKLLRAAHSLKGGAAFVGRHTIETLAHAMETAAENIRDGIVPANAESIDTLLFSLDRVTAMVDDVEHSQEMDIAEPLARLQRLAESKVVVRAAAPVSAIKTDAGEFMLPAHVHTAPLESGALLYGVKFDWHACETQLALSPLEAAQRVEGVGTLLDSQIEIHSHGLKDGLPAPPFWFRAIIASTLKPDEFARRLAIPIAGIARLERIANAPPPSAAPAPATGPVRAAPGSLRVSVSLIDRMMELAGELALVRNQALRSASGSHDPAARRLLRRLDSVTTDLHAAALHMRMQPVATLFDRFPRMVRDLARQLGKEIELDVRGAEVELDKTVIDLLADPLTHLIRNCCDHGMELPDDRVRAGKSRGGRIRLAARQDRGQIVIDVSDDGRGINLDAVRRKALESGLKSREELERLSTRQTCDLILMSGFSTAARVTDLSGRGVGMDVVKTNLDQVGGAVEIDSTQGGGTFFSLRLPLTLAIMPCLLVRAGTGCYAVPQRDVEEILLLDPAKAKPRIECSHDEEVLRLRDVLLPVVRLSEVLARPDPFNARVWSEIIATHQAPGAAAARQYAAVVRSGSRRFVLVFDAVLESEEIVVKPMSPLLRPLSIYAGCTILGDGGVSLIVSTEGIARHSGVLQRTPAQEAPALEAGEEAERLGVLLTRQSAEQMLAIPVAAVRRVIMIDSTKIERVGDRELIHIGDTTFNIVRLEWFLNVSPCPQAPWQFLVVPRHAGTPLGFLVSEILDTDTVAEPLNQQAFPAAGVLGTAVIRGHIALVLSLEKFAAMWEQGHAAPRPALPAARRRILVVEDTQFFQALVGRSLREAGYDVTVAADGEAGLDALRRGTFDLVVSDIEMPIMDGLTMAARIRAQGLAVPLVALTTLSGKDAKDRASAAGFDAYEVKFDRPHFLATISEQLVRTPTPAGGTHE